MNYLPLLGHIFTMIYCPDKGQNIIDKTKFHDNILMRYCPVGHNFTGHNFALHSLITVKLQMNGLCT